MNDQAHKLREMVARRTSEAAAKREGLGHRCRTVAVTSGKGGVGKSNVALMLSIALARIEKKVLLLDADLGLANIHILLGLAPQGSLRDLVGGSVSAQSLICKGPAGVDILPGASGLEQLANLDGPALQLLTQRLGALEQGYDFIIIDTSAGIGKSTTEFCRAADSTLLILTPEPTSLADAYAMVKVLYEKNMRSVMVMVNMMRGEREGQEVFDKLNALVVKFLKEPLSLLDMIPYEIEIPRLIRRQKNLLLEQPNHRIAQRLVADARKMSGMEPAGRAGFFGKLFGTTAHLGQEQ